jgi:uncharacterized protein YndB with AHSA1/START domain
MTTVQTNDAATRYPEAAIEADGEVPAIHIRRDFAATPAQLFRAHTDPELFAQWIGPDGVGADITHWEARDGGSWSYTARGSDGREDFETSFRGCFHTVREDRIVQTFTWEGMPDGVALETMTFEELDGGRCRTVAVSVVDSMEAQAGMMASGMEVGINEGYEKLDELLERGLDS